MKFWSKDLLLVPSFAFSTVIGYEIAGMLQTHADQLSSDTVLGLLCLVFIAAVSSVCNVILAYKLIKIQLKGE